jgi:hypothetical protein
MHLTLPQASSGAAGQTPYRHLFDACRLASAAPADGRGRLAPSPPRPARYRGTVQPGIRPVSPAIAEGAVCFRPSGAVVEVVKPPVGVRSCPQDRGFAATRYDEGLRTWRPGAGARPGGSGRP